MIKRWQLVWSRSGAGLRLHFDGGRDRGLGRQYADKLREEMDRRRLRFTPIDWQR
jgi:hypothetical protein